MKVNHLFKRPKRNTVFYAKLEKLEKCTNGTNSSTISSPFTHFLFHNRTDDNLFPQIVPDDRWISLLYVLAHEEKSKFNSSKKQRRKSFTAGLVPAVVSASSELAHLSLLFERFDGEAVGSDVHYGSQLEPVRWVGRPHRLPILHRTALRALENMTYITVRGGERTNVFSLFDMKVHTVVHEFNFTALVLLKPVEVP